MRAEEAQMTLALPEPETRRSGGLGTSLGIGAFVAVILFALSSVMGSAWEDVGPFVLAPMLIAMTIPLLARQAAREGDKRLLALLVFALILKLLGAILRRQIALDVYSGVGDAFAYHENGSLLADDFRSGNFDIGDLKTTGTDFITILTGIIYTVIGSSEIGGFLFFSWLGFLGLFLFYRAFIIAVPEGRKRTYARLLFFLPSLLFWPSSIGKESWMMFCLGIIAYGTAQMMANKTVRGGLIAALGLWWAALPRAHIAAFCGVAIAFGFILRRSRPELRHIAPIIKGVSLVGIGVVAALFLMQAEDFLNTSGVDTSGGLAEALEQTAERSSTGGSQFEAPVLTSPARAPIAIVTVLYRPTVADAFNPQAFLASAEGTFLALLTLFRIRWMMGALRMMRRRPYIGVSFVMVGLLIVAFSSISNWGLLARERVQLIPFFLVLLSIPPKNVREKLDRETVEPPLVPAVTTLG